MITREGLSVEACAVRRDVNLDQFIVREGRPDRKTGKQEQEQGQVRDIILLHTVKHTLHVQIHHLTPHLLRVRVELLAPGGAGIGEQDVDMVGSLAHLVDEPVQLVHARDIGGDGDGPRRGALVGEGVEGVDGLVAGAGLARGDVDFGAAGLEEAVRVSSHN